MVQKPTEQELWYAAGTESLRYLSGASIAVFGAGRTVCQALQAFHDRHMHDTMLVVCGSMGTELFAKRLGGITIQDVPALDGLSYVYIDGADQIDPARNLIKGGFKGTGNPGLEGCMAREKRIALGANTFVVIADPSKEVPYLGFGNYGLPVEFKQSYEGQVKAFLRNAGLTSSQIRKNPDGTLFVTENGNHILDVSFNGAEHDLVNLETILDTDLIFSNGLFAIRKPDHVIIAK